MRRILALAILATLTVATPFVVDQPQALATVEDTAGVLTTAQAQDLDRRLSQLGPHHFDVFFVGQAPAGAVTEAARLFAQRGLGASDGVIVVSMDDHQVGVHLGDAFAERGVDVNTIQQQVASRFAPAARSGDMIGAVTSLASGLVRAGAQGGSLPQSPGAPQRPGFPWWLVAIPVAAGAFFLFKGRAKGEDLTGRLKTLRARQNQLLEGALKLDEASKLGRFAAGTTADTYGKLASRAGTLLGEASAFGDRLDEADALLKRGQRDQARSIIDELEGRVLPLASEVAAAVTGLDAMSDDDKESAEKLTSARARIEQLKGRGVTSAHLAPLEARLADGDRLLKQQDPTAALIVAEEVHQGLDKLEGRIVTIEPAIAWADLPDQAEDLARRLEAMEQTYHQLRERSEAIGLGADPMLEEQFDTAERALTTPPVDLTKAKSAMAGAQDALQAYIRQVESESERHAQLEAQRQQQAQAPMGMGWGGWMPGPIILLNQFGDHVGSGGFGGGSDWSGGGLGGGGSWGGGGGSSGGGSW